MDRRRLNVVIKSFLPMAWHLLAPPPRKATLKTSEAVVGLSPEDAIYLVEQTYYLHIKSIL
jgi:hypothetical protein